MLQLDVLCSCLALVQTITYPAHVSIIQRGMDQLPGLDVADCRQFRLVFGKDGYSATSRNPLYEDFAHL